MILDLPPDPSFKDLQLAWEAQHWGKSRSSRRGYEDTYTKFKLFFGDDRKPRDVFRFDVLQFREWLAKKGLSQNSIRVKCDHGSMLYNFLNELEVVEAGHNPFKGAAPRRVRIH